MAGIKRRLACSGGGDWFLAVIGGFQQTLQGEYGESVLVPQKLLSQYYSLRSHETAIHSFIPSCKFLHDRMLQAAYESLGEEERVDTHLSIGWRLYKTYSDDEKEERVFELVEQLNHGISLISDQLEIENLIELNVLAAEKAKLSSVWLAADQYSSLALILLGDNAWAESYDKCFKLYKIKAEAAYLNGDLEASKQLYSQLVDNAIDPLDKVELLAYLLVQAIGRSDYALGLEMGRQALSILGIDIPDDLSSLKAIMLEQASQLRDALAKRPIKDFENWPECKDRSHHLTNYVLVNFGLAGFLMQRIEFASVCIQASLISATLHGRTDATLVTLTTYGMLLALRDEYGAAYEAGEKAKQWLESNPNCRDSASAWNGIGVSLAHLKGHVTESYYAYERGFEAGIETGELARAGVCLSAKSTIKAVAGFPIEELLTEYEEAKAFVEKKSLRVPFLPILENSWQSYLKHEYLLGDENFEATSLAIINGSSFKAFLMYCRFEYFFWDEADCETLVAHLFDAVASYGLFKSHFMMVDLYCLTNLAFIRAQREGFVGASHQAFKKLEKVSNELKHILQLRADLYSLNHEHKIALVEAEQLALDGAPFEQTAKRYKQAIKEAEENGFRQYAGLSNEFFGRYLIDIGFESLADVPIKRAHSWYKSWGNKAKIDRLLARYPELAITEKRDKTVPATYSYSSNLTVTQQFSTGLSATSSVRSGEALDFQSIIKSMQTLSGELDLHNLIESMMKVILENAGAHIGVLVVQSLKGPKIEAQMDLPNDQASYLMHIPLEKSVNVPQDIINLTLRLGETIWLENACADGEFKEDAYISKARSKSVLCLPIVYRKSQIGALYLENNLSTGVFTEQRMSVIKVLLTQAAISLENARLFNEVTGLNASLEEKVAQRTRDLDQANVELASANKELESFSYTVSHDLKSPLRMIKGFSDILLDDYASQLDEEAQRILAKVVAGAKSMEDLINGLLDLSRMQRKEVKRTDLNLSEIADTVVANLRDTYPLRVVDIYIQPDMNINGDARMMHSVVENLINNAWKYSSKTESAEIAFSSALVEDELGRTERVFKVKDNGAGFDMSHAGKLFSTFQRLHNKSDFDGTGVGLSTVKRIVEKHGGRVWADSEVGKGASFYFTIPEQ